MLHQSYYPLQKKKLLVYYHLNLIFVIQPFQPILCLDANLAEPGETENAGKFKAKYFQGYITEMGKTSNAEDFVEIALTFAVNGVGADGYDTVTAEQQEVASYVFADTQKTGA